MAAIAGNKIWAFSLIELLVVIAIVSILAALALPTYRAYSSRSKVVTTMKVFDRLYIQLQQHYAKTGVFPSSLDVYGTAVTGAVWMSINRNNIYSAYYSTSGSAAMVALNLIGLDGMPNYVSPTAAMPNNTYSAIVYAAREINGVMRTTCGRYNSVTANQNVPFEYLPNSCQCTDVLSFYSSGFFSAGC